MKPIGPLMAEHRRIERMLALIDGEKGKPGRLRPAFVAGVADFFRTYADRCHHGKEEDIYFEALREKPLSRKHREMMDDLIAEHRYARETVQRMAQANARYAAGDEAAYDEVLTYIDALREFYPSHINKEDNHFFYPSLEYLSREEQGHMLDEFQDFDGSLIQEKYEELIEELRAGSAEASGP
ncbi:MAG: hemerythrin domain-containing protein [Nitrospirota bacterium]